MSMHRKKKNIQKQPSEVFWVKKCSQKFHKFHRKTPVLKPHFIKKEALVRVFSCEFCEISKNTFFSEHLWTTASKHNWNESQEKLIPIYITGKKRVSRQQQQNCFHKNDIRIFKSFLTFAGFPIDFQKCWNCLFCCLNLGITFFCFCFLFLLRKIMNYEFF